ncbi:MAG: DUF4276 family protein [bacterium]|nr:DUF4276 family protein [bacterium]
MMNTQFRNVLILVEGQTEEAFVKDVLNPHLNSLNIHLIPTLVVTKRTASRRFKGGVVSYAQVENDLRQLCKDTSATAITTMIDFARLDGKGFPGWDELKTRFANRPIYDKVAHLERRLRETIDDSRFRPYFSLHEYEALLFSRPDKIAAWFPQLSPKAVEQLSAVRAAVESPELINDLNPPSYRIQEILRQQPENYEKRFMGFTSLWTLGCPPCALNVGTLMNG